MPRLSLKPALYTTTALIGAAALSFMAMDRPAFAITINNNVSATQILTDGDSLIVTPSGNINNVNPAVSVNNVVAVLIDNDGTIYGSSTGINLSANATLSGGIDNSGLIYATGFPGGGSSTPPIGGIGINLSSALTGGIVNSGTITGNNGGPGISISNNGIINGITNTGRIDSFVISSGGQILGGLTNSGSLGGQINIINSGLVDTILNQAAGRIGSIFVNGTSTISAGIDNSGSITGSIFGNGTISEIINRSTGTIAAITGTAIITNGIENNGTITNGIRSSRTITGGINNTNIIRNTSAAINLSGTARLDHITNQSSATITGTTGANGRGIYLQNSAQITGEINNAGTIFGNKYGIHLANTSAVDEIINQSTGRIIGSALTGAALYLANTASITGGLTNAGTISGHRYGINLINSTYAEKIVNEAGGIVTATAGAGGAIYLQNSSHVTEINNAGTLSGRSFGIDLVNSAIVDDIINQAGGTITATVGANYGIRLQSGTRITNDIDNSGLIRGLTTAIYIGGGTIGGKIINHLSGTIDGVSAAGVDLLSSGNTTLVGGLTNNGLLMGGNAGVLVRSGASLAGGLTNSGTIAGAAFAVNPSGIKLDSARFAGGLTNSGTISGFRNGIGLFNGSVIDTIINQASGLISSSASTSAYGIGLSASTITGGITNSGTIDGSSHGISFSNSSTLAGGLINSGTIEGNNYGIILNNNTSLSNGLTNSGTIDGSSQGIILSNGSTLTGGLTNSGTINSFILNKSTLTGGMINSGGNTQSFSIQNGALLTGGITNSGTIDQLNIQSGIVVIGSSSFFLSFQTSQLTGGITNSGTISDGLRLTGGMLMNGVNNTGLLEGISYGFILAALTASAGAHVLNSQLTGGLTNSGTIQGGIAGISLQTDAALTGGITNAGLITGAVGLQLQNGSDFGSLTNTVGGTIQGTGGTAISLSGLDAATPITLAGGRIIGDVVDAAPAGGYSTVTVAGTFATEGDFTVSSLTVNNMQALTISSGDIFSSYNNAVINGTLAFEIDNVVSSGLLVVTNGAADLTNATIEISAASATLANNDQIRIINGTTVLIGGPGATKTIVTDNSFLWDFRIFDGTAASTATDNTDLYVEAIEVSSAEQAATTPNNEAAAEIIDSLGGTPSPELQQIITNLNNAPTQQTVNDILESVTPTIDTAVSDATSAIAHQSVDMINARLSDLRAGSGISSGHLTDSLAIWGQVFGQHASQSKRDNIAGYSANTYGFVGGIDSDHLFDNATVGLAVSYGNSAIKSKDANSTRTDINSYQIGLYGDYNLPQNYFISGSVAYGYNDIQSVRRDVGGIAGLTATGDYSADQYTAHIETGKDFQIKPAGAPTITPTIGATYTHLSPDSYTETGAGGASLTVETDTIESFELGLGLKSKWDITQTDGSVLTPSLHAGYRYDIIGDTIQSTSNFTGGGASFNTQGADPARGTATIGAGLQYKATSNWTLSAGYDFEIKDDYTAHAGILRAGYAF